MITFEPINEDTLYIAKEIVNSNKEYNILENGNPLRTDDEIKEEFCDRKCEHVFIKADDTYIGVISYLHSNPNDHTPWIGLFMIHHDYKGYGYGSLAYYALENIMISEGKTKVRLGVLEKNTSAKKFWERLGYSFYKKATLKLKNVDCYEKKVVN
jgi:RimJ/RimL family protein N-acetyltransferase